MNHPAIKHRPLFKRPIWPWQPYVLAGVALMVLVGILLSLDNAVAIYRFSVIGTFLSIGVLGTTLNLAEASRHKRLLEQVARQTKFVCQAGTPLFGYPMRLVGTYKNRPIIFFYNRPHRFHAPTTKMIVALDNLSNASLRLRGPYHNKIRADQITVDMFGATQMRPVGQEKLFFLGGSPVHVTTNLLAGESLRQAMEALPHPVNIELTEQRLTLSYPDQIYNPDQIAQLSKLLSDLADAIEQKSGAWHKMSSKKQVHRNTAA